MTRSDWPQAEQATLAVFVIDPGFRATVLDAGAEVFSHVDTRRARQAFKALADAGHPIDAAALEGRLGRPLTATPSQDYWPVLLEQRLHRQLEILGRWLLKPHDQHPPTAVAPAR